MTNADPRLYTSFLQYSRMKLVEQYWPRLRTSVESLNEEQIWWRPNEASNSIGNLILHLNGNVRQWLISSFRQLEDRRDRPSEFLERGRIPASALLERLGTTIKDASDVLGSLAFCLAHASCMLPGSNLVRTPEFLRTFKGLSSLPSARFCHESHSEAIGPEAHRCRAILV